MKLNWGPRSISLLIVLGVFISTLTARRLGWLQFLEFRAYDYFIRQTPRLSNADPIVLVTITEDDIQTLDYPLTDETLATLLRILELQKPSVIGLDIWRDVPVPKSRIHLQKLNDAFLEFTNIVGIYTIGNGNTNILEVAPPEALLTYPERLGFNDNLEYDDRVEKTIPKVRRSTLFAWSIENLRFYSLPFRVACIHLAQRGIVPIFDSEKSKSFTLGKSKIPELTDDAGPYVGAQVQSMQLLLDFKHPEKTNFVRYSITDALNGKIEEGKLRDKIVFIGIDAKSVLDDRVTPVDPRHRGVEVQSLVVLQLLRAALDGESPLRYPADWLEDIWLLGWCLVAGLFGYKLRSPVRFSIALAGALLALALIAYYSFANGWWVPLMAPAVALLPSAALVTSYISLQEHRNRGQLMRLFANQVSPKIAEAMWAQRDAFLAGTRPRSQKLTATVLFTDIKGFSSISEMLDPAELMDWLNDYMEVMAKEVINHDGVVEKYIGDSIMAVFGVPVPRRREAEIAQDAQNAVRCALAMATAIEKLNAYFMECELPPCRTRIGIHTGALVAGNLGSVERSNYTVVGDAVNTASRLESFDKETEDPQAQDNNCRILISDATRSLLGDDFKIVEVGTISLKGKKEKVMVCRVLDEISNAKETYEKQPA